MNTSRTLVAIVLIALTSGCERKAQVDPKDAAPQAKSAAPTTPVAPAPLFTFTQWGPTSTPSGEVFNKQPSGLSAIWFGIAATSAPTNMEGWFGDKKLDEVSVTQAGGALVVPTELLVKPGRIPVYLVHGPSKKRYELGTFDVLPGEKDVPTLKVTKWGPNSTVRGQVFNKQSNGQSALWWEADGWINPKSMEVWYGNQRLQDISLVSYKGGNALIPQSAIANVGKFPVYMVHKPSGTKYEIGTFEVTAK
jgi:hypothetical protein